jgi:hypothetical protein
MVRSRDDVLMVRVLADHPDRKSRLLRAVDKRAPQLGEQVLCVSVDGRCVAAPGVVVSRVDDYTFRVERA